MSEYKNIIIVSIVLIFIIIVLSKLLKTDTPNDQVSSDGGRSTNVDWDPVDEVDDTTSVSDGDIPHLKITNVDKIFKLKWSSVEGATSYNVYMSNDLPMVINRISGGIPGKGLKLVKTTTDTFSLYPRTPVTKCIAVTAVLDDLSETKLSNWVPTNLYLIEPLNNAIFKNIAPANAIPTYFDIPHRKIVKSFTVPSNHTPVNISESWHLLKF